MQALQK